MNASLPGSLEALTHIAQIPAYWALRTPQAPAFWLGDQPFTYGQLQAAITRLAAWMRGQGVQPGDRVMVVSENAVEAIALVFAAASLDAWPLSINARLAPREIDAILDLVEPKLQLFVTAHAPEATHHAERHAAQPLGAHVLAPDLPGEVRWQVAPREQGLTLEDPAALSEVALLIATSGSTGLPKAVMVTHRGLLHFCRVSHRARSLQPHDVTYAALPMSHVFGIATLLLSTLYGGGSLYLVQRFDPQDLLAAIEKRGISMLFGVPTMYARFLAYLRESGGAVPASHPLRYAYVGGSALEMSLKQEFEQRFGCRMQHGYGMTEYAGSMFITRLEQPRNDTAVGFLNEGCEAQLVDDQGQPVPQGAVGEIWIRGPGLMRGYYRAPELTQQVMRPGGWFNTGDLGRLDADGALFLVGRSKDMIIRSGFNVYPAEVEAVLNGHTAVHACAVVGRKCEDGNEEVLAFVECEPGQDVDAAELRAFLREALAPYKVPTMVATLPHIPLLFNGKVAKQTLRDDIDGWLAQAKNHPNKT